VEGSGSITLRHGSADPDPHQNVMDPEHCLATLASFYTGAGSAAETDRSVDSSRMGQPETRHHAQRRKMATPTEFEVAAWEQGALTVLQI
jgi:hypothetical protein